MSSTPISLLDRLKEPHDAEGWPRFVHRYTPLLYAWARRTGLQEADVADLLQDVFAVLVSELPRFQYRPGGSFRGWLRTVLLNRWRELHRRRRPALVEAGRLATVPDPAEVALPGEEEERRHLTRRCPAAAGRGVHPGHLEGLRGDHAAGPAGRGGGGAGPDAQCR